MQVVFQAELLVTHMCLIHHGLVSSYTADYANKASCAMFRSNWRRQNRNSAKTQEIYYFRTVAEEKKDPNEYSNVMSLL